MTNEKTETTASAPVPFSITFFPNGMAAVGDRMDQQIGKYNGRHAESIKALKADGYDWHTLPSVWGRPLST